jgi:hypothetical protein
VFVDSSGIAIAKLVKPAAEVVEHNKNSQVVWLLKGTTGSYGHFFPNVMVSSRRSLLGHTQRLWS